MSKPQQGTTTQSIHQRLLNLSHRSGEDFGQILTRFGVERLLYRLGGSPQADQFVLKGAMLFATWTGSVHRPTRDLDLLGYGDPSAERLAGIFREICNVSTETDGLRFDADTVKSRADP